MNFKFRNNALLDHLQICLAIHVRLEKTGPMSTPCIGNQSNMQLPFQRSNSDQN